MYSRSKFCPQKSPIERCLSTPTKPPAKIATFASRTQRTSTKEQGRSARKQIKPLNSVTAAVSYVQTTSQALTEAENKRHF